MAQEPVHDPQYSAESIKVATFPDSVRARPNMYFGYARDNPGLPVGVVQAVIADALWPGRGQDQPANVDVLVGADLRLSVSDDAAVPYAGPDGRPELGMRDSLIPRTRWALTAAAAVSVESVIEIWASGHGWRQNLRAALTPVEPKDLGPTDRVGTRARFELDPTYFTTGATIPRDLAKLYSLPGTTGIEPQALTISADGRRLTTADGRLRITDLRPTT